MNQTAHNAAATDVTAPKAKSVILSDPITRGTTTISEVALRKPRVSDLKGVPLSKLVNVESDALIQLITRISTPTLLAHELDAMSVDDFLSLTMEAMGFFAPPEASATA